jgi:hypothetical protein
MTPQFGNSLNCREVAGDMAKKLPPEETRFKPGQSGNPEGKKPGTKNAATIISKWLEAKTKSLNPITQSEEELTQEDIIVLKQLAKARNGDTRAFDTLMDRVFGKAIQSIDHTTAGDKIENKEIVFRRYDEPKK